MRPYRERAAYKRRGATQFLDWFYCSVNLHCKGCIRQRRAGLYPPQAGKARPTNPDGVRAGDRFGWGQPTLHRDAVAYQFGWGQPTLHRKRYPCIQV